MIHGKYGEDGTISSILDFLNIKYIGNKSLPSLITMDKICTKEILERNNIKTSPYIAITKYNEEYLIKGVSYNFNELLNIINKKLNYPIFIKPANSGSSIGISKINNKKDLKFGIEKALKIDHRILIEEEIIGKELEIGILEQNQKLITSLIGEIKPADNYYTFEAKYENKNSKTIIPANIDEKTKIKIENIAIKIFKILDLHKYSRIDFFLTKNNKIILNEINTIPGFTNISMYPMLFIKKGYTYEELLDILINN